MDKHLRIILELVTRGFVGGARGAGNVFKTFISGMVNGAKSAGSALMNMAKTVFFVREALRTLADAARWVFDTFIKGAGDIAKLEARFIALTGNVENAGKVMDFAKERSLALGKPVEDVANGLALMASNAKDASGAFDMGKLEEFSILLEQMATLRPDLPIERIARSVNAFLAGGPISQLEMIMDMPMASTEALKGIAEDLGQETESIGRAVTYIEGKAGQSAGDAEERLKALQAWVQESAPGMAEAMEALVDVSGLERFQQSLAEIARTLGEPLFVVLNEELSKLADWLQANPDKVEELATLIGETLAGALEDVFEALEKIDWEQVGADIESFMDALQQGDLGKVGDSLEQIGKAIETISQASANFSKFVDDYNRWNTAIFAPERLGEVPGGAELAAAGGLGRTGEGIRGAASGALATVPGLGPGRFVVEVLVNLKDELLEARIRQGADNAVADGFNVMADEMNSGQQP